MNFLTENNIRQYEDLISRIDELILNRFKKVQYSTFRIGITAIFQSASANQYLFNAPSTIGNYYTALVNHDMYGGNDF